VADAMKKQAEEERLAEQQLDDRKRSYNKMVGFDAKAPTEAEMEAFYRKRQREDDPMFQFAK
jgi:pre-mRNA-processing factor SLU7